jgi:hypothetical protein
MFDGGELDLPARQRPGAAVHRPWPGGARARLRGQPGITERSAYGTVTGPAEAGCGVKQKNRRRNRYQTRAHLTLPEPGCQERTAGDILALLAGTPQAVTPRCRTRRMT